MIVPPKYLAAVLEKDWSERERWNGSTDGSYRKTVMTPYKGEK